MNKLPLVNVNFLRLSYTHMTQLLPYNIWFHFRNVQLITKKNDHFLPISLTINNAASVLSMQIKTDTKYLTGSNLKVPEVLSSPYLETINS